MESKLGFSGFTGYRTTFTKKIALMESQDCVVPDTLPDIDSILCTSGSVLIRSKDVTAGHIRIEANIPARVCCAGDAEGQIYCLDVNVPFYISAEDDAISDGSICTAGLALKHLETKMLNPRKISVRAEICAEIICCVEGEETFSTAPQEESAIHALEQPAELTTISGITEKTFVLTDEFPLQEEQDSAEEIISQNADILVQEIRNIGSKLILKGEAHSELIFRTGAGDLVSALFRTPFSQIIETGDATEDALFDVRMLTSGMYYELTYAAEGHAVSMELHLVAQIMIYARREIRYLADAYSNTYELQIQRQQREVELFGREVILRQKNITADVETAESVGTIILCSAEPVGWTCETDGIVVQLLIRMCWRSGDTICSTEKTFSRCISADDGSEEIRVCGAAVQDVSAVSGSGGAEIRISLELRGFTVKKRALDCISSIAYDEELPLEIDDRPTLVILYSGVSADLWTLAKENCSTVEAICAANGLTEEEWPTDRLLLIPKTV